MNGAESRRYREAHQRVAELTILSGKQQQRMDQLVDVLAQAVRYFGGIDNGYCRVCGRHRVYDAEGKKQPCMNPNCWEHRAWAVLGKLVVPDGDSIDQLLDDATCWADDTFKPATQASRAAHLLREAQELQTAPNDSEEMADVLMLLGHLARHAGVDLLKAGRLKLEKNRTRKWGEPDAEGVCEHVKEPAGE